MKTLCIIPARGGSKRIPRKNIKEFCGKPIISYSISAAIESGIFDEVMVSTDDEEIASLSRVNGAVVPFYRSKEKADDFTGLADVIIEVITEYAKAGKTWDIICCILPTAPFLFVDDLIKAYKTVCVNNTDAVVPIVKYSYPIQRSLRLENGNKLYFASPEYLNSRSQDLPERYHDSGQFYFIKKEVLLKEKSLFPRNTEAIIIPESRVQDVDTFEDWKIAEFKYRSMLND